MPHPAAGLVDDIARVRTAQDRELVRLGRGPTLDEQREMADFAAEHRQLFADLELSLPRALQRPVRPRTGASGSRSARSCWSPRSL